MKLRPFELGLVIAFLILSLISLILLSTYKPPPQEEDQVLAGIGMVNIWGTLSSDVIRPVFDQLAKENVVYSRLQYRYVSPETINDELVRALADGLGPDAVLMSHESLVEMRRRILPLSYENTYPKRDIQTNYIDGAHIFALSDAMYAFPIAVDPMVMFWNRRLLAQEGFLVPPETWELLVNNYFPELIRLNANRSIDQSVVAMGEYQNIRNAFGIISALFIQGGSYGVAEVKDMNTLKIDYYVRLSSSLDNSVGDPFLKSVDFYTRFARSDNSLYSWNRSIVQDQQSFIGNRLAFYFGFASEGPLLEKLNPNLSFDIAPMPQGESATLNRTYGKFYGLSILRSSKNPNGTLRLLSDLASRKNADRLAEAMGMVSVYREGVLAGSNDVYGRVAYQVAPTTFGWLNPNRQKTDEIFRLMVEDVIGNRRDFTGATGDAINRLREAYE